MRRKTGGFTQEQAEGTLPLSLSLSPHVYSTCNVKGKVLSCSGCSDKQSMTTSPNPIQWILSLIGTHLQVSTPLKLVHNTLWNVDDSRIRISQKSPTCIGVHVVHIPIHIYDFLMSLLFVCLDFCYCISSWTCQRMLCVILFCSAPTSTSWRHHTLRFTTSSLLQ